MTRRIQEILDDAFYEAKAAAAVGSILGRQIRVRRARTLKGPNLRTDQNLAAIIEEAELSGRITEREANELLDLDIRAVGTQRADGARAYVAVEASITASRKEITRAASRAGILSRATGVPSHPLVIAEMISDREREVAREEAVTIEIYLK